MFHVIIRGVLGWMDAMSAYRFYLIENNGDILEPAETFDLPDDATAIKAANHSIEGHDLEIWHGARVVAYVKAKRKSLTRHRR
jgi:hypothetical protein